MIATDPISERRPVKPYIDAIETVTKAPIKYFIYSHSDFDPGQLARSSRGQDQEACLIADLLHHDRTDPECLVPQEGVQPQ